MSFQPCLRRPQAIVSEAETHPARILAAQAQAIQDCEQLKSETAQAVQSIDDGVERIHEMEFEVAVRAQLARKRLALGEAKAR